MTQVCSLPSSTASASKVSEEKRLPKGIHIVGADRELAPRVEKVSHGEDTAIPWGYIFIHHLAAEKFVRIINTQSFEGSFHPKCFIHRTVSYRHKSSGKGIMREERPTISGLVFLQGSTTQLRTFLSVNFPQYHLVRNCMTGLPASIPDSIMRPFMKVMDTEPERITFLRDPFIKFAKKHIRLRVLTGLFQGQEGYVVRVDRDRQLVMNLGGYAVAISNVHNEWFEVAE